MKFDYETITPQDIVDRVWERLNDGKGAARSPAGGCFYLNNEGNKCAVGIFLPDDPYIQSCSGGIAYLIEDVKYYNSNGKYDSLLEFLEDNIDLLARLQGFHDNITHWNHNTISSMGTIQFQTLCKEFNLKFPG